MNRKSYEAGSLLYQMVIDPRSTEAKYVILKYKVVRQSPAQIWVEPVNLPNNEANWREARINKDECSDVPTKKSGIVYFTSKAILVQSVILQTNEKIRLLSQQIMDHSRNLSLIPELIETEGLVIDDAED